jgi:hypothetical protein
LAGVGVGDLAGLVGVHPDLAFTAAGDGRRKALLGAKRRPARSGRSVMPSRGHRCLAESRQVALDEGGEVVARP